MKEDLPPLGNSQLWRLYTSYVNYLFLKKNLNTIQPDVVAVYLGINDNIYNTFPWVSDVPVIGFFNWKSVKQSILFQLLKYHLWYKKILSTPEFKNLPNQSKKVLQKSLEGIVNLSKDGDFNVVLSTFAISYPTNDMHLINRLNNDISIMKHFWGNLDSTVAGIAIHNNVITNIAHNNQLTLAQVGKKIPHTSEFFIDLCHLTTRGAEIQGEAIANAIVESIAPSSATQNNQ